MMATWCYIGCYKSLTSPARPAAGRLGGGADYSVGGAYKAAYMPVPARLAAAYKALTSALTMTAKGGAFTLQTGLQTGLQTAYIAPSFGAPPLRGESFTEDLPAEGK